MYIVALISQEHFKVWYCNKVLSFVIFVYNTSVTLSYYLHERQYLIDDDLWTTKIVNKMVSFV